MNDYRINGPRMGLIRLKYHQRIECEKGLNVCYGIENSYTNENHQIYENNNFQLNIIKQILEDNMPKVPKRTHFGKAGPFTPSRIRSIECLIIYIYLFTYFCTGINNAFQTAITSRNIAIIIGEYRIIQNTTAQKCIKSCKSRTDQV